MKDYLIILAGVLVLLFIASTDKAVSYPIINSGYNIINTINQYPTYDPSI